MATQQILQGTLNRVLGSVFFSDSPELNITAGFLDKGGISLAHEGNLSDLLPTLTGAVVSPVPYVMASITIHLLKTQSVGSAFKSRMETSTTLGTVSVYPDVTPGVFTSFQLNSCVLQSFQEMAFDGTQPGFIVKIQGVWNINSNMFLIG